MVAIPRRDAQTKMRTGEGSRNPWPVFIADALADLGQAEEVSQVFAGFQKYLYVPPAVGASAG